MPQSETSFPPGVSSCTRHYERLVASSQPERPDVPGTVNQYATLPIDYPSRAVDRVIAIGDQLADALLRDLERRPLGAGIARAEWIGVHRTTFDTSYALLYRRLGELYDQIRSAGRSLEANAREVAVENGRRAVRRAEAEAERRRQEWATASAAALAGATGAQVAAGSSAP